MMNHGFEMITERMMGTGLFHDQHQCEEIFFASLMTLRDRLSRQEARHLASLLPRNLYEKFFDNWVRKGRQGESVNKSEFLAEVAFHLDKNQDYSLDDLVPVAMHEILNLLSPEEASHLKHTLPVSMRNIFDDRISME